MRNPCQTASVNGICDPMPELLWSRPSSVINTASAPLVRSISSIPSVSPREKQMVERASPSRECSVITVTPSSPLSYGRPVAVSRI